MPDEWMLYWVGSPDARAPSPPGRAVWPDLEEREARLGFRDRQPILVDPDYRVDPRLSEFFRRSRFATRAPGTQESYALDYRLLFTFLWRQGRYWDQARPEDLEDYEYWRRKDQRNPVRVGGAKWARELAALLLLSSGLRRREAATLLLAELPEANARQRYSSGRIAVAVAKRRGRYFYVSQAALKAVETYRVTTRAAAVARAQRQGTYARMPVRWVVRGIDRRGMVRWVDQDGQEHKALLDVLDEADRRHLYQEGEGGLEPLAVWLTEAGLPMRPGSWNKVFAQANQRCQQQRLELGCSPHMLRHSMALSMLIALHYALDRRMGLTPAERRYYQSVYGNVWTLVKDLLGHASEETTRAVYLEPVTGLQLDTLLNEVDDDSAEELLTRLAEQTGLVLDAPRLLPA